VRDCQLTGLRVILIELVGGALLGDKHFFVFLVGVAARVVGAHLCVEGLACKLGRVESLHALDCSRAAALNHALGSCHAGTDNLEEGGHLGHKHCLIRKIK